MGAAESSAENVVWWIGSKRVLAKGMEGTVVKLKPSCAPRTYIEDEIRASF